MLKELLKHSILRDRKAIKFHYGLSNDFYKYMLDRNMVYSCAYFRNEDESLNEAQENKLDLICRKLRLKPGEKLLDIGCGWGALIIWAAKNYDIKAYGITNSRNQFELASEKIKKQGLEKTCKVEFNDYRELEGEGIFDKIASVGMFEHIGIKQLPRYFGIVKRILKEDGLFLNHGITAKDTTSNSKSKFTTKYIFPDGELDVIDHVLCEMRLQGFEVLDIENLRLHYSKTLAFWAKNLQKNKEAILSFLDEKIYRAHLLHAAGASQSFKIGNIDIYQILASKSGNNDIPMTREDIYRLFP